MKENKRELIKIVIGTGLFVIALLYNFISGPFDNIKTIFIFIIPYIILGGDIIISAIKNILKFEFFDENFLMTIATLGAIYLGMYEEATAVVVFYGIGEYLQDLAVDRSKKSVKDLINLRPDTAIVLNDDGSMTEVDSSEVSIGEKLLVKPGSIIPADGTVESGSAMIDTSPLTGESLPVSIDSGDSVMAGCVNIDGLLTIKVSSPFISSKASKIINLIESSGDKKSPSENFIRKFSKIYTPVVCFIALVIAIVFPFIFNDVSTQIWLYRALTFLVVSCPCALVISVPLAFYAGIGEASKSGILIKGGGFIEKLSQVSVAVFDKTGTLTNGRFIIDNIMTFNISEKELLEYVSSVEKYSAHPLALSICEYARLQGIDSPHIIYNFENIPGRGVKAEIAGKKILIGNREMILESGIENVQEVDTTNIYISINNQMAGIVTFKDELKTGIGETIETLKIGGTGRVVMLTGDCGSSALQTAEVAGISEVYSGLLPEDKNYILEKIISETSSGNVIFTGDGINDAPAIRMADVGIAMGGIGTDAAMEASDIVIMNDDIQKISEAVNISRMTMRIVYENIAFAISIKLLVLLFTAIGATGMWMAVFADVGVCIVSVLNSMRRIIIKVR